MSTRSTLCSKVAVPSGRTSVTPPRFHRNAQRLGGLACAGDRGPDVGAVLHFPADRLAGVELVAEGVFFGLAGDGRKAAAASAEQPCRTRPRRFRSYSLPFECFVQPIGRAVAQPQAAVLLRRYGPSLSFNRPPQPSFSRNVR